MRYNGFLDRRHQRRRGARLLVGPGAGAVERIAAETLPKGIGFEWTELTYQEILAGNSAIWVFPLVDPPRLPRARRAVRKPASCRCRSS